MKLSEIEFLFLDCQTTGMRPTNGHLLELAWTKARVGEENSPLQDFLLKLPEAETVSATVTRITGIGDADLTQGYDCADVFAKLQAELEAMSEPRVAVIHYAQFEKPWLQDLFTRFAGREDLPLQIICSHQLCKKLLPNLPSPNIRGASGYFGKPLDGIQRAGHHVRATQTIWQGLVNELEQKSVLTLEELKIWLKEAPKTKATRYEYRLDKLKRLELPDSPGIYRMISRSGEVLYVGKATSLKNRVNSYFRGQKNRDRFKLEMLAQVWDLQVTDCATPLEAALLETDEIKRLNPRYNIALKKGTRHLLFYNHDFTAANAEQTADFPLGPFRNSNWIEHLRLIFQSLNQEEFPQVFYIPISPANLRAGFELFCALHKIELKALRHPRSLLTVGMWLLKNHVEEEEPNEEPNEETSDTEPTVEELADKFERLFRRAAAEYRRSKKLTRLLNAKIRLQTKAGPRELTFYRGTASPGPRPQVTGLPWQGLALEDFDRMSILHSELDKYTYEIESTFKSTDTLM